MKSRLKKIADITMDYGDMDYMGLYQQIDGNPGVNFSQDLMTNVLNQGFRVPDLQDKIVDKDPITKQQYNSTISREWLFEQPIDNAEWLMQDTRCSSRLRKLKK